MNFRSQDICTQNHEDSDPNKSSEKTTLHTYLWTQTLIIRYLLVPTNISLVLKNKDLMVPFNWKIMWIVFNCNYKKFLTKRQMKLLQFFPRNPLKKVKSVKVYRNPQVNAISETGSYLPPPKTIGNNTAMGIWFFFIGIKNKNVILLRTIFEFFGQNATSFQTWTKYRAN